MKNLIKNFVLWSASIFSLAGVSASGETLVGDNAPLAAQVEAGTEAPRSAVQMLVDAQAQLTTAQRSAVASPGAAPIIQVVEKLKLIDPGDSKSLIYYKRYWVAYGDYLIALKEMRGGNHDIARNAVFECSSLLDGVDPKDAEGAALQSLCLGLQFAFLAPSDMMAQVGKVNATLGRASAAEPRNIRVLYAEAVTDNATPQQYGGGSRAEGLLRTALGEAPGLERPLRPSWGQDLCAALLVDILLKSNRSEEAKAVFEKARADFPSSLALAGLAQRF